MMTPKRLALLRVAHKQLGFDEDTYRAILLKFGGVESAKDLDEEGFAAVMRYFTSWGFRSTWTQRTYGNRPGRASPRQVALIKALWREFSGADDEAALNRWLERSFKVSALRFATPADAHKAIGGLRAMLARKAESAA